MARGIYVGVNGVPKKMSKMYIGVKEGTPIYSDGEIITIDNTNISEYFSITDGTYGFVWNATDNAFSSNNGGVHSSTATSTWTALKDMKNITLNYSYSSESGYDKFTLTIAGKTIANAVSGSTTIKTWSGDILAGQTIVLTYKKDSSANRNEDKCKIYDIKYDTRVLLGTKVEELARTVKKAYIGVNGIAKKIFPPYKILEYKGTATPLSESRCMSTATTVGNYALFGGGTNYNNYGKVDTYDTSLTKGNATELSYARCELASTTVGNYALFGGGIQGTGATVTAKTEAYDTSLTRTIPTELSYARYNLTATTVGNYALFGGGYSIIGSKRFSTVDAYDTSLTRTTPTGLSEARSDLTATTVGNYALFGGGFSDNGRVSTVDVYDTSLTRTTITPLSIGRDALASTTVGNYALFGGGESNGSGYSSTVDVYQYD